MTLGIKTKGWRRKKPFFSVLGEQKERDNSEGIRREKGRVLKELASEGLALPCSRSSELNEGERVWPGFEEENVLISGHAKRREAGLDGNRREVS